MERSERTRGGRGRGRGTGRGARRGGVRTRGGRNADSSGVGSDRPSASTIFAGTIEDLAVVQPLERPKHAKRLRVLVPRAQPAAGSSLWSSMDNFTSTETPPHPPPASILPFIPSSPISSPPSSPLPFPPPSPTATLSRPASPSPNYTFNSPTLTIASSVPSPAEHVSVVCSTPTHPPTRQTRPAEVSRPGSGPIRRRLSLHPPSTRRSLEEDEIFNILHFGSDEEEDDEDEDYNSVPVPRATRMFLENDDDDEVQVQADAVLTFQWPPQPVQSEEFNNTLVPEPEPMESEGSPEFEPTSKFKFVWGGFPESQMSPELRREPFSNINCGPTVSLAGPYEAFTAIWDREIMESIVIETNRYAEQLATEMLENGSLCPNSRITKWKNTNVDELYTFFGIILAMGIVVKTRIEEYWSKSSDVFSTPGFAVHMKIDRFHLLCKCLHFRNNVNLNLNQQTMSRAEAKLFKIQPIIDHLNQKFPQLYKMQQNISLDESLLMWKGWLDINQFINNKAASVGIKTYEICDSKSGYLWRFEVHAGHNPIPREGPVSGFIPALVLRLLKGLEHKGHTLWMDNFYNSPALARELKVLGFDCVGTLRTNREFVPNDITKLKKSDLVPGQVVGCTSGDVDIIVWRDKNKVAVISTFHGLAAVRCSDGQIKPSVVADYNICMGGVDRKDQMLAMYPVERKRTRVWYKKFFRRLLNVSVLNAYILVDKEISASSHRDFRKNLVIQIFAKHSQAHDIISNVFPEVAEQHFPAQYGIMPNATNKQERQRRNCTVCKKRTNAYCKACNVPLCVFTCFEPHHSVPR